MKFNRIPIYAILLIALTGTNMVSENKANLVKKTEVKPLDETFYCYCWTNDESKDYTKIMSNIVRVSMKGSNNYSTRAADYAKTQFQEALKAANVDYDWYHTYGSCSESESEAAREKRDEKGEMIADGYSVREFQFRYYNED